MKKFIIAAMLPLFVYKLTAQDFSYNIETAMTVASEKTPPTWHLSNRQGVAGDVAKFGYLRAGIAGNREIGKEFNLNWGADVIAGKNLTSTVYIQQAFADISWRMLTISAGQKERWGELKNHRLSSGGLVESGNARPIPQIRIEVPEYYDFFGTNGWFKLRGHIAYGWFTDGNWQKDWVAQGMGRTVGVRYHSKAIFFKVGKEERFPLSAELGLQMTAQFGGTVYNKENVTGDHAHNPNRLKDYFKAFVPSSGDDEYSDFDKVNIAGNQVGSWHGAINWKEKNWEIRAYYEHLFDDHSQMFWEYGLWTEQLIGIELKLKNYNWIKGIVVEYYNLKNQSGPVYHDTTEEIPDQISCRDNNYNHEWYNGWFNYGMIIGTPLATSPIYNEDNILKCYNNRVEAFHLGIEGEPTEEIGYRLLLTRSNNWGTYNNPFTDIKSNTAGLIELSYKPNFFKGWCVKASYAFDNGALLGNCRSGMLTITKSGVLNLWKK
jgi:hypothetical protein